MALVIPESQSLFCLVVLTASTASEELTAASAIVYRNPSTLPSKSLITSSASSGSGNGTWPKPNRATPGLPALNKGFWNGKLVSWVLPENGVGVFVRPNNGDSNKFCPVEERKVVIIKIVFSNSWAWIKGKEEWIGRVRKLWSYSMRIYLCMYIYKWKLGVRESRRWEERRWKKGEFSLRNMCYCPNHVWRNVPLKSMFQNIWRNEIRALLQVNISTPNS